ncbi:MAG: hypothetical protein IJ555_08440 [Ruminococcus sp.]|nr:hypothetical protein [Ruminococcus sp.]MBR1751884.1 hypothetical protein [Ruminococcus sp.]MBR1752935.1 hypothetical protein [Ruminococcus sp.]
MNNNFMIELRYPDRPSVTGIISKAEFYEYVYFDRKLMHCYREQSGVGYDLTNRELLTRMKTDFLRRFNKASETVGRDCTLIVTKDTDRPIVTDISLLRLELAYYWADEPGILACISRRLSADAAIGRCQIGSRQDISELRTKKNNYVRHLMDSNRKVVNI